MKDQAAFESSYSKAHSRAYEIMNRHFGDWVEGSNGIGRLRLFNDIKSALREFVIVGRNEEGAIIDAKARNREIERLHRELDEKINSGKSLDGAHVYIAADPVSFRFPVGAYGD